MPWLRGVLYRSWLLWIPSSACSLPNDPLNKQKLEMMGKACMAMHAPTFYGS
jgi:hypothetical protein